MTDPEQDYSAVITWTSDWLKHLAENSGIDVRGMTREAMLAAWLELDTAALSIVSSAVTCDDPRVSVDGGTMPTGGYQVVFTISQSGIETVTPVTPVVQVILSNGDSDDRDYPILFTNT